MRTGFAFLCAAFLASASATAAHARILIQVDKSTQRMTVSEDGQVLYNWPVSTGKTGHATPSGSYQTFRMERDHFSKEWDDAPMPYSIFFTKVGHAIHGTNSKNLGMPVSHGCVRLSVGHAATLYAMVQKEGVLNTKVVLTGSEQIALKRGRTRLAEREENIEPQQPGEQAAPYYGYQYPGQRYYDPRYGQQQRYNDPRYADRRYGEPDDPAYENGRDDYRPHPRYTQPQPYQGGDFARGRYGIY